jgi:hypothetical protein
VYVPTQTRHIYLISFPKNSVCINNAVLWYDKVNNILVSAEYSAYEKSNFYKMKADIELNICVKEEW